MLKNELLYDAIYKLEKSSPECSIRLWLSNKNRIYLFAVPLMLMISLVAFPYYTFLYLFIILNGLYFIAQFFKTSILLFGVFSKYSKSSLNVNCALPIYTILLPLYKEDKVVAKLVKSLSELDYPKELLDIKLLIEEDDTKTLQALANITLPKCFEIIYIPISYPRTKPKACNYGLSFAKGKYITIYDAEDRPHPKQLKEVVHKFANSSPDVICIQAKLNFYNKQENNLTKLFAIEYSLLFDYMIKGLKKLNMPIPLGGTSNHFIKEKLKELGGWDAFNVTEDADLGIRLYYKGYSTDLIDSTTYEESPITVKAWITQRSRWIKGHILTSLLHLRQFHKLKPRESIGIILSLCLPNLIYLLLPIFLIMCCFMANLSDNLIILWKLNLILSVVLPVAQSIFIILAKQWYEMKSSIALITFYYWLLPIAGFKACWQIFNQPFHWDKSEHGVSNYA